MCEFVGKCHMNLSWIYLGKEIDDTNKQKRNICWQLAIIFSWSTQCFIFMRIVYRFYIDIHVCRFIFLFILYIIQKCLTDWDETLLSLCKRFLQKKKRILNRNLKFQINEIDHRINVKQKNRCTNISGCRTIIIEDNIMIMTS